MSEKLDELMKLADATTKMGMAALEKEGIPWRLAMGSATEGVDIRPRAAEQED